MNMETMYANYCAHGFLPEHAQVAMKSDFNAVRKAERELGQAIKRWVIDTLANAGKPIEVSRVTVREDKGKKDGEYIPRAVFFTYTQGDDTKKTGSYTFASIVAQRNARVPDYEQAKARYDNGVDIDGERVYREQVDGVMWYIAQDDPGEPPGTNDPETMQAVVTLSERWEEAVASLIAKLDIRVTLQTEIFDELEEDDFFCEGEDESAPETEAQSLMPKGLGEMSGGAGYFVHGTKGEVWRGAGWSAWKVDARFRDGEPVEKLDRWAKHFVETA